MYIFVYVYNEYVCMTRDNVYDMTVYVIYIHTRKDVYGAHYVSGDCIC